MLDILGIKNAKPQGGRYWYKGRRPLGDAPMTCLGIIIATIALGVWAYYHFWHNRSLEKAGQELTVVKKADTASTNAYRFRVRDRIQPAVSHLNKDVRKALIPIYKGKVTDKEETLSELNQLEEKMRDLISDVNEAIVPTKFEHMHKNFAECIGYDWQALCKAREAINTDEDAMAKSLIKESKSLLAKGNKCCEASTMSAKAMFK